jgi:galactokinase
MTFPISARAPGRVELLGNHTDYNDGVVLSAAIHLGVTLRVAPSPDGRFRFASATVNLPVDVPSEPIARLEGEAAWANYLLGVVDAFRRDGLAAGPFHAELESDLPLGAGLSSSAALEVATARALEKLGGYKLDPMHLAQLCKKAENGFVGVNCGLLDQVSSVFGKRNHAIYLDCRATSVDHVPIPETVELLITHSCVAHALVGGEYNERRAACFEAAKLLGVPALRDVTPAQLEAARPTLPDLDYRRAAHVVGENDRVFRGVEMLRNGDIEGFGQLMFDSHASSRANFENSTPELDALVEIARGEPGALGARLTGGGFGGATVTLVAKEAAASVADAIARRYRDQTGHTCRTWLCEISDGAA